MTPAAGPASAKLVLFGAHHGLGRALIPLAAGQGYRVTALLPEGQPITLGVKEAPEIRQVRCDDPQTYRGYLDQGATVIYFCGDETGAHSLNELADRMLTVRERLLLAAAEAGVRQVVFLGDANLFAPPLSRPNVLTKETNPILNFGYGRVYRRIWEPFRAACRAAQLGVRVHPGTLYGQLTWFQKDVVEAAKYRARVEMTGSGGNWITPVHVQDAAQGLILAALHGEPDQDYLLGRDSLTLKEFIHTTLSYMGLRFAPRSRFYWWDRFQLGALEAEHRIISCRVQSHAAQRLGWSPVFASVEQGIPHALKDLGSLAWR